MMINLKGWMIAALLLTAVLTLIVSAYFVFDGAYKQGGRATLLEMQLYYVCYPKTNFSVIR